MNEVERIMRSGTTIENFSLLTARSCGSTQCKPNSTETVKIDNENNGEGISTTLKHGSKPAELTEQFQLKFKKKVIVRDRPKRALK